MRCSGTAGYYGVVPRVELICPGCGATFEKYASEDRLNNDPSNLAVFPSQAHHVWCHAGRMDEAELQRFRLVRLMAA